MRELIRSYFQASEKYKQSTANPDRMDVGAIKGKFGKEEKGKSWNQYGKGKDDGKGKSWNQYGKSGKDDKGKGKFGKGKYKQGKDTKGGNKSGDVSMKGTYYKAPANSQFQGECSHCGKWGHKASECWRKTCRSWRRRSGHRARSLGLCSGVYGDEELCVGYRRSAS